jgi:hypothetical protein
MIWNSCLIPILVVAEIQYYCRVDDVGEVKSYGGDAIDRACFARPRRVEDGGHAPQNLWQE